MQRVDAGLSVSGTARSRSASIRDVARIAGVSHQTVSRVINRHAKVSPATRERVQKVIDELGFRPNASARALANGDTQSVTVLMSDTTRYGYLATLTGIEEAARAASFSVGIVVIESGSSSHVRAAIENAIDTGGALVVVAFDKTGQLALREVPERIPMAAAVESPASAPPAGAPWCWIDDEAAARDATRYLLELGHPTVHYVALPSTTRSSRRTAGWRSALRRAGIDPPTPLQADWGALSGHEAGVFLSRDPGVSAILCGNDEIALGVLSALHAERRKIPGDVSVAGFDDEPQSAFYTPALTTTKLDFVALGRSCFATVTARLGGEHVEPHPVGTPELVVRASTGSPRRARS
ncbi:MAG: LacI family DNA-binding transcriptional regulator [Actinomycetota bacterium]|nr:LacI family DNA-binding transcriptional regulator [Actinomycetota bacterium]